MANLNGPASWTDVYQIENDDPVVGGQPNPETRSGMSNIPHLQLFQRTLFLRALLAGYGETLGAVDNLNTISVTGARSYPAGATGAPTTGGGALFHFNAAAFATQVALAQDGTIYSRGRSDGAWSAWRRGWNTENDGMNSGLDADTVGGKSAGDFAASNHLHDDRYLGKFAKAFDSADSDRLAGRPGSEWTLYEHSTRSQARSLSGNGYQFFPSGLVMQWGTAVGINDGGSVVFPIAFLSACYTVLLTDENNGGGPGAADVIGLSGTPNRTSFGVRIFNINGSAETSRNFRFLAIGR